MAELKIGWARRDISTDEPIKLPGQWHIRISQGVAEPCYATALAIDGGDDLVIFVSCDLTSLRANIGGAVREELRRRNAPFDENKIIINATHTHTAPSALHNLPDEPTELNGVKLRMPETHRRFVIEQICDAVTEAWETRKPGKIAYGYGYAVVAHSRRVIYFDDISLRPDAPDQEGFTVNGHGVMYGETNDANFSHYEAGADHFLNCVFTYDLNDKLTGAIINVPCPSQNSEMEYKISADYWADVRELVKKQYGDIFILTQCAAAGDLSPRILHYREAQDRRFRLKYPDAQNRERAARKDIAERIMQGFAEILSWAQKEKFTSLPVKHVYKTLPLEARAVPKDVYEDALKKVAVCREKKIDPTLPPEEYTRLESLLKTQIKKYDGLIERYEKKAKVFEEEVHAVRLGNIAFTTCRFELYMDYQHRIQARSPFEQTFLIQLCAQTDETGSCYLPTERAVWAKGYSADLIGNKVSHEGGQQLVEGSLQLLNMLKEGDKK